MLFMRQEPGRFFDSAQNDRAANHQAVGIPSTFPVCQPLLIPQRVHGIPPGCPGNLQAHRQEHNEKREQASQQKSTYPRIHAIREIL